MNHGRNGVSQVLADLDFSKDYVHINGVELFSQQLGIPAKLAKLGAIQVINRHPDSKAGKGGENLAQCPCIAEGSREAELMHTTWAACQLNVNMHHGCIQSLKCGMLSAV